MADGEWLTLDRLSALNAKERQDYIHQRLKDLGEENSDDEPLVDVVIEDDVNPDDSDAEQIQLPEYNPEDESEHDEELDIPSESAENYAGKDGTIWSAEPPQTTSFRTHNRFKSAKCGPVRETEGLSIVDTFRLIMSDEMCDIIIRETNRKAILCYERENTQNPTKKKRTWKFVTRSELDAYLGLLLLCGVTHSGCLHTNDLWKTTSHPLFRAAMCIQRFWSISRFIRFDNGSTRQERKENDKSAAVENIFLMLNSNLRSNYVAGANVTVDEQLYAFRGGSGFTQYIPSKPAKYGIKVWWVCDSISSYPLHGQIYTGTTTSGDREKNVGERVVKDLCVNLFRGSGRNIVCDNFFTSYNLARSLMMDSNLSMLAKVNKRRKFVPPQFAIAKRRALESTIFGFSNNITMCSYVPKKNKSLLILSTKHYTTEVEGPKKKPLMLLDYNKYKGSVDNMNKCLAEYTTKRRTNRWPLAFFYNILDVAAFAAYIIYVENNPHLKAATNRRRMFLQQLSEQLAKPEIEVRANNTRISRIFSTRNAIEAINGGPLRLMGDVAGSEPERDSTGRIKTKGNCYICAKRRPTRKACTLCKRPVCAVHSTDMPQCNTCS